MCGIAGYAGSGDRSMLRSMCDAIYHRGPDSSGYYVDRGIGLGNRRLSIIDLEGGRQPIHNEDGSVWITYNGEVFNYPELKESLEKKGHRFYTSTDTEAIVHLYEEKGDDCVKELNGMFAFAIWDSRKRKLFLARDRLGIKPLYYSFSGSTLIFASEIKAILKSGLKVSLDPTAIDACLTCRYVPSPLSIFNEIRKLPPGHSLAYEKGKMKASKYWDLDFTRQQARSEDYYVKSLRKLMRDAVKRQLISDVPLGAFLSGGIDSSSVVCFMSKASGIPVRTFSIGFTEEAYSELDYARKVAGHFGTDHHEFSVEADFTRIIPEIVEQFDEPISMFPAIHKYYVSKMARKHVTVALGGDGGDELFAGYPWYLETRIDSISGKIPPLFRKCMLKFSGRMPLHGMGRLRPIMHAASLSRADRFASRMNLFWGVKEGLYASDFRPKSFDAVGCHFSAAKAGNFYDRAFYAVYKTFLADYGLVISDSMSMLHSLEQRVPLLDHRLVELSASMPYHYKIRGGTTKYIFRKAMAGLLPREILSRGKMGPNLPPEIWIEGEMKSFPEDILLGREAATRHYFNQPKIRKLLHSYRKTHMFSGEIGMLLWLELWMRKHVEGRKRLF